MNWVPTSVPASKQLSLIKQIELNFEPGETELHLTSDSPWIAQHHTNWRLKAIESLGFEQSSDIHYSSVLTLNHQDAKEIRILLLDAISEARKKVSESQNEDEAHVFLLDFFQI